jgi:hypothetical protein
MTVIDRSGDEVGSRSGLVERLGVGAVGPEVTRLHEELRLHGIDVPAGEMNREFFGPGTREAVLRWQEVHGLDGTGEVDEPTAVLLAVPFPITVEATNGSLVPPEGETTSSPEPRREGSSAVTGTGNLDPSLSRRAIEGPATVEGLVTDNDGLPVAGARVRAFTVGIRDEQPFGGEVVTDANGRYAIPVRDAGADGPSPNVRVAVVDAAGVELATSAVRFGSAEAAPLDLSLPRGTGHRSEFDQHMAAVEPALAGVPLTDAGPSDIAFLSGATGIPTTQLEDMVEAAARSVTGSAGPVDRGVFAADLWYGWKSAGVSLENLWELPTDQLVATVIRAGESGVIAPRTEDDLASIRERIEEIKLDLVLELPAPGTTAKLGELLTTTAVPLDRGQQRALARVAGELRPDDPGLFERVAAVPGFDGDAAGVARALRLGAIAGGHVPMVRALQSLLGDEQEGALKPLTAVGTDELIDLAFTHGSPDPTLSPVDYAEGIALAVERLYPTAALAAHLERGDRLTRQPLLDEVPVFLRENPSFDVATTNLHSLDDRMLRGISDRDRLREGLVALQRLNAVGATVEESGALLENGISSPQEILAVGPGQLVDAVGRDMSDDRISDLHQRALELHNVTLGTWAAAFSAFGGPRLPLDIPFGGDPIGQPDDDGPIGPPGDDGLTPPQTGREPEDPNELIRRLLFGRDAVDVTSRVALVPRGLDVEVPLIVPDEGLPSDLEVVERHPPLASMLQRLFGPQDTCACEHCGSVLGPSAYFVDLLKFVDDAELSEYLFLRRPDLRTSHSPARTRILSCPRSISPWRYWRTRLRSRLMSCCLPEWTSSNSCAGRPSGRTRGTPSQGPPRASLRTCAPHHPARVRQGRTTGLLSTGTGAGRLRRVQKQHLARGRGRGQRSSSTLTVLTFRASSQLSTTVKSPRLPKAC